MSERCAGEIAQWFDGKGYDVAAASLIRVTRDAWAESARRATAAERERGIQVCEAVAREERLFRDDHTDTFPKAVHARGAVAAQECADRIKEADDA